MKTYPFLSLKKINEPYEPEIKAALNDVVNSGWYLHGKYNRLLEDSLKSLCSTDYAIACSNGLDALRLIFRAYIELGRLHPGDEVIVQANTYIASVLAITDNGLCPILVEPDPKTLNLDFQKAEEAITPRTKAIMTVHLYGTPCWTEDTTKMARRHNLIVVEDNAQAIGAEACCDGFHDTSVTGGLGDAAAFSFYPTKNIGAAGDAGAVTTNDESLAKTIRTLANYGADKRYHNIFQGLNCRMDEMQAAVLCVKLAHLSEITAQRRRNAAAYDRAIVHPAIIKPRIDKSALQVWHQYEIRVTDNRREAFRLYLKENGVETDIHYAVPPHRQPCYARLPRKELPVTELLADEIVSLPIAEYLTDNDIREIAGIINRFPG